MTEFYAGQSVYVHSPGREVLHPDDAWVCGVVWQISPDGRPELVEVEIHNPSGCCFMIARPGELVKGDGG